MKPPEPCPEGRAGFSFIEVLLVLAIVTTLLAGALGVWRHGAAGPALRAAETEVAGLLTLARSHALRLNAATRLLVELEPATTGQRRFLQAQDPVDGTWRPLGPPQVLAAHAVILTAELTSASSFEGSELTGSHFHGEMLVEAEAGPVRCGYIHFSAAGTSFGSAQLVVLPARPAAAGWTLGDPGRARLFLIRPGGGFTIRGAAP